VAAVAAAAAAASAPRAQPLPAEPFPFVAGGKSALLAPPHSFLSSPAGGAVELPPAKPAVPRLARLGERLLIAKGASPLAESQSALAAARLAAKGQALGSLARSLGGGGGAGKE
jgi:hypothetical protein